MNGTRPHPDALAAQTALVQSNQLLETLRRRERVVDRSAKWALIGVSMSLTAFALAWWLMPAAAPTLDAVVLPSTAAKVVYGAAGMADPLLGAMPMTRTIAPVLHLLAGLLVATGLLKLITTQDMGGAFISIVLAGPLLVMPAVLSNIGPSARVTSECLVDRSCLDVYRKEAGQLDARTRAYIDGQLAVLANQPAGARRAWAELEKVVPDDVFEANALDAIQLAATGQERSSSATARSNGRMVAGIVLQSSAILGALSLLTAGVCALLARRLRTRSRRINELLSA